MATAAAQPATTNGTKPAAPASRLAKVQKGRILGPARYLIYGPEGVGKTTLAAAAPAPIINDIEDGSSQIDVARYPFRDGPSGHVPQTYEEVLAGVDDLMTSPHSFETLIYDSVDRLESLIWKFMMARDSKVSAKNRSGEEVTSIEDYGYGKGYQMAVEEWRSFCARLDRLRYARGMEIVLIGHAQVRTFKNPEGEDYDRYQLRINDKAAGFLKEWADVTAFACFEESAAKIVGSKQARPKGFSTGRRILKLGRSAAVDAKTRLALPDEVEIDIADPWRPFAEAVAAARSVDLGDLEKQIKAELERIGDDDVTGKALAAVKEAITAKDGARMQRFLHTLQQRPAKEVV